MMTDNTTTGADDAGVEAVALAISCHTWATISQDNNDDCCDWGEMPEYIRHIYRSAARAAIATLARLPTTDVEAENRKPVTAADLHRALRATGLELFDASGRADTAYARLAAALGQPA